MSDLPDRPVRTVKTNIARVFYIKILERLYRAWNQRTRELWDETAAQSVKILKNDYDAKRK